jgi:ATP-dependent DNA helicase RecG
MALKILYLLNQKTSGKQEIAGSLGKERPSRYLSELIARLMREEMIAMTIPDKPNSRLQKYRLTSKGKALLAAKESEPQGSNLNS